MTDTQSLLALCILGTPMNGSARSCARGQLGASLTHMSVIGSSVLTPLGTLFDEAELLSLVMLAACIDILECGPAPREESARSRGPRRPLCLDARRGSRWG